MVPVFIILSQPESYSQIDTNLEEAKRLHIGITTGINSLSGIIGPYLEYKTETPISVYAGIGLGTWGAKITGGARYYLDYPTELAFNLGLSRGFGIKEIELDMETNINGTTQNKMVPMELHPASALNLSALYFIKMGRHSRFNFEFGYSIPLTKKPYTIKNGDKLSIISENALKSIQPGGVILGIGFTFGI